MVEGTATIERIEITPEPLDAYNLEVAVGHTFFIGESGLWVHNGCGSYTIILSDGKRYPGKGGKERMAESIKRLEARTKLKVVAANWTPAPTDRDSFIDEHRRLEADGGPRDSGNHNKIHSLGKKMSESEGGGNKGLGSTGPKKPTKKPKGKP